MLISYSFLSLMFGGGVELNIMPPNLALLYVGLICLTVSAVLLVVAVIVGRRR